MNVRQFVTHVNYEGTCASIGLFRVRLLVDELLGQGEHLLEPAIAGEGPVPEMLHVTHAGHLQLNLAAV